jgi:purine-binding chemotaxis protein CheW
MVTETVTTTGESNSERTPAGGRLLVFAIEGRRLAIELGVVERIVQAVAVTPLPHAPPEIRGVINVQGDVLPVIDLRRQLKLGPDRPLALSDGMILASASRQRLALLIDGVQGVVEPGAAEWVPLEQVRPGDDGRGYFRGAVKLEHEIVLIYDVDAAMAPLLEAASALAQSDGSMVEPGTVNVRAQ